MAQSPNHRTHFHRQKTLKDRDMQRPILSRRPYTKTGARLIAICALCFSIATLWAFRGLVYKSWTLAVLPFTWHEGARFILSDTDDAFDVTFSNYSRDQLTAAPYDDVVPPVFHHIALGMNETEWKEIWGETVQSCLDMHPRWETHMWTDANAEEFVRKRFPEVLNVWKGYRYPVQRVDALRYMVLYEYGGAILDMDLKCRRALGPLRRFSFVAPEAHPTGFSVGFMMASKHNAFVGELVNNLARYDVQWLGLPYATVMFSSGCHYASVIHKRQSNRAELKILPGPLHSLNGRISTPIFDHLGSSSWHSYDAWCITTIGKIPGLVVLVLMGSILAFCVRKRKGCFRRFKHGLMHR